MSAGLLSPAQRTSRGGRRPLAWALICFTGVQAAFWGLKEGPWPEARDPEYAHKVQRLKARLGEAGGRPVVVLLGSSRICFGVNTDAMAANHAGVGPAVFNFGMCQCTPVLQRMMLRRMLADGVRPDHLVIEWYPPFMSAGTVQADQFANPVRLNTEDVTLLRGFSERPDELYRRWLAIQPVPTYHQRQTLMNRYALAWVAKEERFDHNWDGMQPWGWTRSAHLAAPMRRDQFEAYVPKRRADYDELFRVWTPSSQSDTALEEMLDVCRREGIPVTLFWAPEPAWMRAWYTPDAESRVAAYLTDLSQRHGVAIVDGRAWVADVHFLEEMHVLHAGAAECARRFEAEALPVIAAKVRR